MHICKISAVKTLETSKYDDEKGKWINPPKGVIKWDEDVTLAEAAIYNNMAVVVLTYPEYQMLKEGFRGSISHYMRKRLIEAHKAILDILEEDQIVAASTDNTLSDASDKKEEAPWE